MDLIGERDDDKLIFGAFVRRTLEKRAKIISEVQENNMPNFKNPSYAKRTFEVNNDALTYRHKGILRFLDMKRLTFPKSRIKYTRKRIFAVHNTVIMKQYNATMMELTYGLSDSVISEIKAELRNKSSL